MQELFARTFPTLRLVPEAPYTTARALGMSKREALSWDALEPTALWGIPS